MLIDLPERRCRRHRRKKLTNAFAGSPAPRRIGVHLAGSRAAHLARYPEVVGSSQKIHRIDPSSQFSVHAM
jgi:hypothetical protein